MANTTITVPQAFLSFVPTLQLWQFSESVESWTGSDATVAHSAVSDGVLELTDNDVDPQLLGPTISINGAYGHLIRMRVRATTVPSNWQGAAFYQTSGHGYTGGYYKSIANPSFVQNVWQVLEWDMSDLTAGGTDWVTNTITKIRFDLSNGGSGVFEIDWIQVVGNKQVMGFVNTGDSRLIMTGYAPTINPGQTSISVPTKALSFTGKVTSRLTGLFFSGFAPTALVIVNDVDHVAEPATASSSFTGKNVQRVEQTTTNTVVAPDTGSITSSGKTPVKILPVICSPTTGEVLIEQGYFLRVVTKTRYPFFAELAMTGYAPTILRNIAGTATINPTATTNVPTNNEEDQRTGFRVLPGELVEDGYGVMTRQGSGDSKHPQEMVGSTNERQEGADNPGSTDRFIEDEYPNGVSVDDL